MVKKSFSLIILLFFVFLASGCTIIKCTACNIGGSTKYTKEVAKEVAKEGPRERPRERAREGSGEDIGLIKKADNWVRENLW